MSNTNTGGPAFASGYVRYSRPPHDPGASMVETDRMQPMNPGLSLRDYFAAKAMQSILIDPRIDNDSYRECAEGAYKAADAMLKAREA